MRVEQLLEQAKVNEVRRLHFQRSKCLPVNHMCGVMKVQILLIVPDWSSLLIELLVWIGPSGIVLTREFITVGPSGFH